MTTENPIDPNEPQPERPARQASSTTETGPTFAAPQPTVRDLSGEIVRAVPRAADERVTCRWIAGDQYRCNWWGPLSAAAYDNPGIIGLTVTTHRVRRSQWLRVTKTRKGLVMDPPPLAVR